MSSRGGHTLRNPHSEDLAQSGRFHPEKGLKSSCPQSGKLEPGIAVAVKLAAGS